MLLIAIIITIIVKDIFLLGLAVSMQFSRHTENYLSIYYANKVLKH